MTDRRETTLGVGAGVRSTVEGAKGRENPGGGSAGVTVERETGSGCLWTGVRTSGSHRAGPKERGTRQVCVSTVPSGQPSE